MDKKKTFDDEAFFVELDTAIEEIENNRYGRWQPTISIRYHKMPLEALDALASKYKNAQWGGSMGSKWVTVDCENERFELTMFLEKDDA